jgi:hypothetical protein
MNKINHKILIIVIIPVGFLQPGEVVSVEASKITLELQDVYIIEGRANLIVHFMILL